MLVPIRIIEDTKFGFAKDACLLEREDDNKSRCSAPKCLQEDEQLVEAFVQQFQEDLVSKSQEVQKNESDTVKQHSTSVLADKRIVGSKDISGNSMSRPMAEEVTGNKATHVSDEANKSRHSKRRKLVPSVIGLKKMARLSATNRDALIRSLKSSKRKKATGPSSKSSSRDKKGTSLTAGSGSTDTLMDSKDWKNWVTLHGNGKVVEADILEVGETISVRCSNSFQVLQRGGVKGGRVREVSRWRGSRERGGRGGGCDEDLFLQYSGVGDGGEEEGD
ncbi:hypothetical protein TSUD_33910 [Trifolium subterraneum]|uniref:Uncharacterized protein n=1 Tax=Trifolium subterraneum TaxID=3900 RepID=A0A2Z6LRL9_TRISU|nr:hypothetical protein TSUD_33910 [Trifolium subterraneum]